MFRTSQTNKVDVFSNGSEPQLPRGSNYTVDNEVGVDSASSSTDLLENCREFDTLLSKLDRSVSAGDLDEAQDICQEIQGRQGWKEMKHQMQEELENSQYYHYNSLRRHEVQRKYQELMRSSRISNSCMSNARCSACLFLVFVSVLVCLSTIHWHWLMSASTGATPSPGTTKVPPISGSMSLSVDDPDGFLACGGLDPTSDFILKSAMKAAIANVLSGKHRLLRVTDSSSKEASQAPETRLVNVNPEDIVVFKITKDGTDHIYTEWAVVGAASNLNDKLKTIQQRLDGVDMYELGAEIETYVKTFCCKNCTKGYDVTVEKLTTDNGVVITRVISATTTTTSTTTSTTTITTTTTTTTSTTTTTTAGTTTTTASPSPLTVLKAKGATVVPCEMVFIAPGTASNLTKDSCTATSVELAVANVLKNTAGHPNVTVEARKVQAVPFTDSKGLPLPDVIKVLYEVAVPPSILAKTFIEQMALVSAEQLRVELDAQVKSSCPGSPTINVEPGLAPLGPDTNRLHLTVAQDAEPDVFARKEEGVVCMKYAGSSCSNGAAVALSANGTSGYLAGIGQSKACRQECEKNRVCGGFSYADAENICFLHRSSGDRCQIAQGLGGHAWVTYLCSTHLTKDQVDTVKR